MLSNQKLKEIKADVNYFIRQLIEEIDTLRDANNYLENQNEILKKQIEGGTEDASE